MKVVSLALSALSHATEDKSRVVQSTQAILPLEFSGEPKYERVKGYYGNEIVLLRLKARSPALAEKSFTQLWMNLSASDRDLIQSRLGDFVDSTGTLFLRFNKQESARGRIVLNGPETIKVEIRLTGKDTSPESILENLHGWLRNIPTP